MTGPKLFLNAKFNSLKIVIFNSRFKLSKPSDTCQTLSKLSIFCLVVCSVTTTPPPRPPVHLAAQTAVRSSTPKPVLTVRPPTVAGTAGIPVHPSPNPTNSLPQRVLLSPDMQARLPCKYAESIHSRKSHSYAGFPIAYFYVHFQFAH